MIDAQALLRDLQKLVKRLEDDLREGAADSAIHSSLMKEYQDARKSHRTSEAFEPWRDQLLTQSAVAWILGTVFIRFMEDNGLIPPTLSGADPKSRQAAKDREDVFFQHYPTKSDRDYLESLFREVEHLPGVGSLFDERHNLLWSYQISGDAAKWLIRFWREVSPDSGKLVHDFADQDWNTRFLGDLYQDLSEAARKRYALLQTPEFVEEFILDRTLEPAIDDFGLEEVRMIDPTCGSGHFLLGGFFRMLEKWYQKAPGVNERVLVQRALDGVYGVDLNPFAVAIARFRLLVAALKASHIQAIKDAPNYRINLVTGDSLLHGKRFGQLFSFSEIRGGAERLKEQGLGHAFRSEDLIELDRILGQQYHAVVGNPPYITVKDKELNQAYRERYATCYMQYSMSVPFIERFFELALAEPAGFVGMITADSFMKREFGKKLVENFFIITDLTHVIMTSGAYIPGHGTPTLILFGRHKAPQYSSVRVAMGIKGEPSTPSNPAKGFVWQAILGQIDQPGSESEFISVVDIPREVLAKHPWSLGGGGAKNLFDQISNTSSIAIVDIGEVLGGTGRTSADDAFIAPKSAFRSRGIEDIVVKQLVEGNQVRDWNISRCDAIVTPYSYEGLISIDHLPGLHSWLWRVRTTLGNRVTFGHSNYFEEGRPWWEWHQITPARLSYQYAITFGEVATHNHFVLDRGGRVFKQTAPIIILSKGAGIDDYLRLIGILNSSMACFWLKQVCQNKGSTVDQFGARQRTMPFEDFFQFSATKVAGFPLCSYNDLSIVKEIDFLVNELAKLKPMAILEKGVPTKKGLLEAFKKYTVIQCQLIAYQEELDWHCYYLYGLIDRKLTYKAPPEVQLGQRAFEIAMARKISTRELETTWFNRHNSTPTTEIPVHWPEDYKTLVTKRIEIIEMNKNINLVERPEYKRRWNVPTWEELEKATLKEWLLDRLETKPYWPDVALQSISQLANRAMADADFMQVAELYRGQAGFDVKTLVSELVEAESVPSLPVLRFKESGLRHHQVWKRTWELQRQEDAFDALILRENPRKEGEEEEDYKVRVEPLQKERKRKEIGDLPAPPKYKSADFLNSTCWRLRGALDVPKERFISFPGSSRGTDPSLLVGWAGWNHLERAQAVASYAGELIENEGFEAGKMVPLFSYLFELIPWLKQWHNEIDPRFNARMGDFFEVFLESQLPPLGLTRTDLEEWKPIMSPRRGRR